jgi:antitoxin component YwqK of YwqJK toxin-antitoxin module
MKIATVVVLCILAPSLGHSQKVDTVFYSLTGKVVSKDKYSFYSVLRQDSNMVRKHVYSKNGRLFYSGGYKSRDLKEKTGPFKYYSRKRLRKIFIYEALKYPQTVKSISGDFIDVPQHHDSLNFYAYYYRNGNFKSAGYRSSCCNKEGNWIFLSKDKKFFTIESYNFGKIDGPFKNYYLDFVISEGFYKNGKKDGEWHYYHVDTHSLYKTEIYLNDKRIKKER